MHGIAEPAEHAPEPPFAATCTDDGYADEADVGLFELKVHSTKYQAHAYGFASCSIKFGSSAPVY